MAEKQQSNVAMERYRDRLLSIMTMHIGNGRKIGMGELFQEVFLEEFDHRINDTRKLRRLVTRCRRLGHPICSDTYGYWLASAGSELTGYCKKLETAALKKLKQSSIMKQVGLPELLGQLRLDGECD